MLNEFLANPKTQYSNEWVRLFNSGDRVVDLANWYIDDGEGGTAPYRLPSGTVIAPHGYLVVDLPKAMLNNNGDTVRLLRPDGTPADSIDYSDSQPDVSRSRAADGSWYDNAVTSSDTADTSSGTDGTMLGATDVNAQVSTVLPIVAAEQELALPNPADEPTVFHAAAMGTVALNNNNLPASVRGQLPAAPTYAAYVGTRYRGVPTAAPMAVTSPEALQPDKDIRTPLTMQNQAQSRLPFLELGGFVLIVVSVVIGAGWLLHFRQPVKHEHRSTASIE